MKIIFIVLGLFAVLLSAYGIMKPEPFVRTFYGWRYDKSDQPSDQFYEFIKIRFFIQAIVGIVMIVLGIFVIR